MHAANFLAPTGAQEEALWVGLRVCLSVIFVNSSLNLHAIFMQFSCNLHAVSRFVSSQLAVSYKSSQFVVY